MSHRNLTYLNNKRIVYRKYSSDDPTDSFDWGWYYAEGTYGYYCLFNTKAKINSYKSLKMASINFMVFKSSINNG